MVYRRKICIIATLVLIFFIAVVVAFMIKKDTSTEYRGTLVNGYSQEAVV